MPFPPCLQKLITCEDYDCYAIADSVVAHDINDGSPMCFKDHEYIIVRLRCCSNVTGSMSQELMQQAYECWACVDMFAKTSTVNTSQDEHPSSQHAQHLLATDNRFCPPQICAFMLAWRMATFGVEQLHSPVSWLSPFVSSQLCSAPITASKMADYPCSCCQSSIHGLAQLHLRFHS